MITFFKITDHGEDLDFEGRKRVVIEGVRPEICCGVYPIKRVTGEEVNVLADIIADGHDSISARVLYKKTCDGEWMETPMVLMENDLWSGAFIVETVGTYLYTIEGWVDHFRTWQRDTEKKAGAGQEIGIEVLTGIRYLKEATGRAEGEDKEKLEAFSGALQKAGNRDEALSVALARELSGLMARYPDRRFATRYERDLAVVVDRQKALFSTWYECFPRSVPGKSGRHGTFKDCGRILPELAKMGFDVLYLPPVHPIGRTNRKGRNNSPAAAPEDAGSPWAIGSEEGGHKAVHRELGTFEDFAELARKAGEHGIELALDLAFQCSPDHPYVKEHPGWFKRRPDGSIQYAENPPKKYEDIFPINFETDDWKALWHELKDVVLFWVGKGIRIFRVDNPHTKSFAFWEWLIKEIKKDYPEIIFLSEAFTRPKVMYRLARIGFTQSYTYFTWRNTEKEFIDYLDELTRTDVREYFRPNFWPNTPDILAEHLQYGGRPVFMIRLVLAATLSSNYGIYGPPFELCVREALPGKEEYLDSEKYEIRDWDWDMPGNLRDFIARINRIRRENPALRTTWNLKFYETENDRLLFYGKATEDFSNIILVVINLDPDHTQSGWVHVPVRALQIDPEQPYLVHDLIGDDKYIWHGERNYVELDPRIIPARVFRLRKRLKKETDFDYFM